MEHTWILSGSKSVRAPFLAVGASRHGVLRVFGAMGLLDDMFSVKVNLSGIGNYFEVGEVAEFFPRLN